MAWPTVPGSGALTIDGNFSVSSPANILINPARANIQSGSGVLAIGNAITIPVSLGSITGGVLFVQSGNLRYIGPTGTITTIASG